MKKSIVSNARLMGNCPHLGKNEGKQKKRKQKRKDFQKWKELSANCKKYFVASVTAL
jgi:hypothetical protein